MLRKYPPEDIFLFCWAFNRYLIFGMELPREIPNYKHYNEKKGNDIRTWTEEMINPWSVDLLFREYITHYEDFASSQRSFLRGSRIRRTMNLIGEISNEIVSETKKDNSSDIESYLWRLQYQQFVWQDLDLLQQYLRYYILYSDKELKAAIKGDIDDDFDIDKILLIGGLLWVTYLKYFFVEYPIREPEEIFLITKDDLNMFQEKFVINFKDLLNEKVLNRELDEGFEFKFNPLRRHPLVIINNKMYCPEPMLLVDLMTKGLRYMILEEKQQGNANRRFGLVFEEYCHKLTKATLGEEIDVYKDDKTETKDGTPRTVDIILDNEEITIFGECKSGYIYKDPYNESLEKALEQIAKYLEGAYFSLGYYKDNMYPQIKYTKEKKKELFLILLDDIYIIPRFNETTFTEEINDKMEDIAKKRGREIDRALIEEIPWKICSIREYEYFLAQAKKEGLKNTLEKGIIKENPYIVKVEKYWKLDIGKIYGIDNNVFKNLKSTLEAKKTQNNK